MQADLNEIIKIFYYISGTGFCTQSNARSYYSNDTAQTKWEKLESGLVLISAERKKKKERQFNKFHKERTQRNHVLKKIQGTLEWVQIHLLQKIL